MSYSPPGPDNEAIRAIRDAMEATVQATDTMKRLTWVIAVLTLVNTVAVIVALLNG